MANNIEKITALLKIIASNIVFYRKQLGLTQDELAAKADIDRTYIGYLENAKHNITVGKLVDIASALNVPLENLFRLNSESLAQQNDIDRINALIPFIREYQTLAEKYEINDVFQDNGGKHLQMLLVTGLINIGNREGNDAVDANGREYELKSVNSLLTQSFSTHHHLNPTILGKYRSVDWIFAVYEGIEIKEIYLIKPLDLEYYFKTWEEKWNANGKDINNPKIPLKYVRAKGALLFKAPESGELTQIQL